MGFEMTQGDALVEMKNFKDEIFDMVLCDPPYGVTNNSWDTPLDLPEMWKHLERCVKPNAAIVFFAKQPFTSELVQSGRRNFKQSLVWVKNKATGHLNAKRMHMVAHEDILVFSYGSTKFYPQKTQGHRPANYARKPEMEGTYGAAGSSTYEGGNTDRYPTTVLHYNVVNNDGSHGEKLHPSQKPVDLLKYLIESYSQPNDTILDFTAGSGSTGVAALETGRNFVGIEKDETFCKRAVDRLMVANALYK